MQNSIFKSFEDFVMSPVSILKGKIINIVNLKTNLTEKKSINVDIMKNNIQINVVNNEKVYNLLSIAMYKKRMKEMKADAKNQESKIFN
ncbi:MAG: hypothetical protein E7Z91_05610 [Cyanobacteria bacterium SIG30]|nr:hypothetical protein [Cyanobacteria bacterium SIG30]